jgi:hypothetical protein
MEKKTSKGKDLDAILNEEAASLLRTAIERAKGGDGSALRLALERIQAPLKERSIKIDMPPIEGVNDLPRAIGFVVGAVSKGALTPSEGTALTGMLGSLRSAYELVDLAKRIDAIELALPGSQPGAGAAWDANATRWGSQ